MTDQPHPQPVKRPRGAQPGNINALKHGFYASRLPKAEVAALETSQFTGLAEEIALLRIYIRRIVELGVGLDDLPENLQLLRILCLAAGALTRLVKTNYLLTTGGQDDLVKSINQAINDVAAELAILSPPPPLDE